MHWKTLRGIPAMSHSLAKRIQAQATALIKDLLVDASDIGNQTATTTCDTMIIPHLNAPSSSSGSLQSAQSVKESVALELDGHIWLMDPPSLDAMLEDAATEDDCANYLRQNSSIYHETLCAFDAASCENDMYAPATKLFQSILNHFGLGKERTVIDVHSHHLHHIEVQDDTLPITEAQKTGYSAVDFVVMGTQREFDFTDPKSNPWIRKGVKSYITCLTPIDAKFKGSRDTEAGLVCQAGMYARACLNSQRHRNFVYVVMINQDEVRLYYFDHCGALVSKWISFKEDPTVLIRMLLLSCKLDSELVGLNPAVSFDLVEPGGYHWQRKIVVDIGRGNMTLTVLGVTWSSNAVQGRKTICWRVCDEKGNHYILKESSPLVSRTPKEWAMLKAVNDAKVPITGVGKMVGYMEGAKFSDLRKKIMVDIPYHFPDRQRYYILLEPHGPRITNFKSPLQLLCALRDAVSGHQQLWNLGILHRDINTNNILLGDDAATDGNQGLLIDLDLSTFLSDLEVSSDFGPDFRTATHVFRSLMTLWNSAMPMLPYHLPHDYLDDFESFFYVVLWITKEYEIHGTGTNMKVHQVQDEFRSDYLKMFEDEVGHAFRAKQAVLLIGDSNNLNESITTATGWGPAFTTLLTNLCKFLAPKAFAKFRLQDSMNTALRSNSTMPEHPDWLNDKLPLVALQNSQEPQLDYETFIGYFDQAISEHHAFLDNAPANLPLPGSST